MRTRDQLWQRVSHTLKHGTTLTRNEDLRAVEVLGSRVARSTITLHLAIPAETGGVAEISHGDAGVVAELLSLLNTASWGRGRGGRQDINTDCLGGDLWLAIRSQGSHRHDDGGVRAAGGGVDVALVLLRTTFSIREGERLAELITNGRYTFSHGTDHLTEAAVAEVAGVAGGNIVKVLEYLSIMETLPSVKERLAGGDLRRGLGGGGGAGGAVLHPEDETQH